jgi:purine-nucleoside phosphorylase
MDASTFDDAVFDSVAALRERGVPAPHALLLLGTGVGVLPGRIESGARIPLEVASDLPSAWEGSLLHYGELQGLPVWMLEDAPADPSPDDPPWAAAFPIWLAAAAGASTLIHTTAGSALDAGQDSLPVGSFALLSDHINLSGRTPLLGLGETRLGPLFPDQTTVHDRLLREAALGICEQLGLAGIEAVGVCTTGPTLDTPAERRWFASTGALVSAQRLATPLLAAAHAGLGTLSIVLVTNAGDDAVDIAQVAAVSNELAPALDDLLFALAAEAQQRAMDDLEREGE